MQNQPPPDLAELRQEIADSRLLQTLSATLAREADAPVLYEKIVDAAVQIMRSDFASLQMFFPQRGAQGELFLLAHRGFDPEGAEYWKWVGMDTGSACGEAFRTGQRCLVGDVAQCPFIQGGDLASHRAMGMRAVQTTPLFSRAGALIGMISTHWKNPHEPSGRDWRMFDVLAQHAADLLGRVGAEEALARQRRLYEGVLTTTPDLAYIFDLEHRFIYANEGLLKMWGKSWDEAIGRNCLELGYAPWHAAMHDREIEQVVATKKPIRNEVPFTGTYGRRIYDYIFTPVLDERGEVIAVAGTTRDITDLKQAEQALREAHAQLNDRATHLEALVRQRTAKLQEALGELEAFSYSVAHDLRAPLRAMSGYADALSEETGISPEGRNYLARIVAAATRLDRLTQEVLTYSRLSREETRLAPVNLDQLAHEIVEQYPEISAHRAHIELQSPLQPVLGQESLLTQALSNLLINACKFVEPGANPAVRLRTEAAGDHVRIWVEDHGIGIEPRHRERLFKLFGRIHPESKFQGTGVGLAIVKKAAERMGGSAGFESEPGQGSQFWLELKKA